MPAAYFVGDVVAVSDNRTGTIKFHGPTKFAPGTWFGLELDSNSKGKNNGTVRSIQYFEAGDSQGVFVKPDKVLQRVGHDDKFAKGVCLGVGNRVECPGRGAGTVKFVGPTQFADDVWFGIQLEGKLGKHNGRVKGVRYFDCPPRYGVFYKRPKAIEFEKLEDIVDDEKEADGTIRRVLLVGAPGSGKTTIAPRIAKKCGIPVIDARKLVRDAMKSGDLGSLPWTCDICGYSNPPARTTSCKGCKASYEGPTQLQDNKDPLKLVSDDQVTRLVQTALQKRSAQDGFVLHHYPNNITQAEQLDDFLATGNASITNVVELVVSDSVLKERVLGRRVHPGSGRLYHTKNMPPDKPGYDDVTNERLVQMDDDKEGNLQVRQQKYLSKVGQAINYYRGAGLIYAVHADVPPSAVWLKMQKLFGDD